jgi:transcription termination factor Rho
MKATRKRTPPRRRECRAVSASGVLELHPKGYGFLRDPQRDYRPTPGDAFVAKSLIADLGLRPGNLVRGLARPTDPSQGPRLDEVFDVDGFAADQYRNVEPFDGLTPVHPREWLRLETGPSPLTTRVMDLLTPLGKGQRALIVAPPRTGKTVLLQHIGGAITSNYPDVKLFVLLTDERPEEVTEMRRQLSGEVLASSLDRSVTSHVRLSRLTVERCKRLAETGTDVVLLIDSLTRMARAFNKWVGDSGRTMTGGVDVKALDIPKHLFASARAFEEGGSLTIVATALVDTGSRMDEVIFQEFKGTGNMELVLDRALADRRVWPAMDISQSGTRREEMLLDADTLHAVTLLRRTLATMHPREAMEQLTARLAKFRSNREFIAMLGGVKAFSG